MKTMIPILLIVLLLAGCGLKAGSGDGYQHISQEKAQKQMETHPDAVILDVRTREEYSEGHIPGAICIPNESIGGEAPAELPDKNALILVYCRSGNRSRQAADKLAKLGYTDIQEFGGINTWPGDIVTD